MEILIVGVAALLVIAAATALGPKLRIASPLILVVLGIAVSFTPILPDFEIDPEWILAGILPPLLYSAAVSMPAMNFRRELNAIGGLSIVLVVISAVVLGLFFSWAIPGLGLWWGIALGAIVSPTDAVATSIVKRLGVGGRVVSVLEGESLLNDATALVLLRSAIAATAAALSFWEVVGQFAYAVAVAVVIGFVVGHANLWVRQRVTDSTVNTAISFAVPFLASIPAEELGASGLVAAVVAGLITGHGGARRLPPRHRASDAQNWRTVELVLEGAIFLIMGLELSALMEDVERAHEGVHNAVIVALGALLLTLLVRAAVIVPLLGYLRRRRLRRERIKPRIEAFNERIGESGEPVDWPFRERSEPTTERVHRTRVRMRRLLADFDYYLTAPLGWREGGVLVWAGMRGAVTLAAAQTLPADTPNRSLLVLVAFVVAAASLLVQGGTLGFVVKRIRPAGPDPEAQRAERAALLALLADVARRVREEQGVPAVQRPEADIGAGDRALPEYGAVDDRTIDDRVAAADGGAALAPEAEEEDALADGIGSTEREGAAERERVERHARVRAVALAVVTAQRAALLDARDDGTFDAETLDTALATLDAAQISIELQGAPPEL
jgi:CPA1 family monovalent cation:H+ antiporter